MDNPMMVVALAVLFVGFGLLAAASVSFFMRAVRNKQAWNGATRPFLLWGLLFMAIGLVALFFVYRP